MTNISRLQMTRQQQLESYAASLIGVPYRDLGRDLDGLDCWGLYRLLRKKVFGQDLPDYSQAYLDSQDKQRVARLIEAEQVGWSRIAPSCAMPGDMLVFHIAGYGCHVACFLAAGSFIHALPQIGVGRASLRCMKWQRRLQVILRPTEDHCYD